MASCPLKVAIVQNDPQVGMENKRRNVENSIGYIAQAGKLNADLVVFPELANTGYAFATRQEAFAHGESIEHGESVRLWKEAAKEHQLFICAGLAEKEGSVLYNSSVLIGPQGLIGTYRKTHLWENEKLYFKPGSSGFPVFDTEIGRIGMAICWDAWFPEVFRILGAQGADIVCSLNNFSLTADTSFDDKGTPMSTYLMMSHAHMNGMFVVSANRVGAERGERFIGGSLLVGPQGWPLAEAPSDEETMLVHDIDLALSRQTVWSRYNDLYGDRRVDLYDGMLGYRP